MAEPKWSSTIVSLSNTKSKKICPYFLGCIDNRYRGCIFVHPIDTFWKSHHCAFLDEYVELIDLEEETTS